MRLERNATLTMDQIVKDESAERAHHVERRGALRHAVQEGRVDLIIDALDAKEPRLTIPVGSGAIFFTRIVPSISREEAQSDFDLEFEIAEIERAKSAEEKLRLIAQNLPQFVAILHNLAAGLPNYIFRTLHDRHANQPMATIVPRKNGGLPYVEIDHSKLRPFYTSPEGN